MPPASPGVAATWGVEDFSSTILMHLAKESVLLRAGCRLINVSGTKAHLPRLLNDGAAVFVAEGDEIPSDAPDADQIVLTPRKLANVAVISNESVDDNDADVLDGIGQALARSIGVAMDARALSSTAQSAIAPAGLLVGVTPGLTGAVTLVTLTDAVGAIEAVGGQATAIFANAVDVTAIRQAILAGNYLGISDPTSPGAEVIAGARIFSTPAMAAGSALIADAREIVIGIRSQIDVQFSSHAKFTADSVVARVTARADWALNDARGVYLIA